ncbi:hypothetical protein ABH920_007927 [Catenulispora sp. EB89]|uniref:hypothetical protein n=1 Tax=Catenulispora sp. EB89 TaxID=3156257 RepID=UPI003513A08F
MDETIRRARFLGRGAVTLAMLLTAGMVGSAGAAQANAIPCTLTVTNPAYAGGSVSSTAIIHCAYPTTLYLEADLSYNGGAPVAKGQNFGSTYSASLTVSGGATPGDYQASAIAILGDGEQYGWVYSSTVYIPQ